MERSNSPVAWNLSALPSQNTFNEWREYQKQGGTKTCQNCHMPDSHHSFLGPHYPEFLHAALVMSVKQMQNHYEFTLKPKEVGHRFPTGDLFRHLTLEVASLGQSKFRVVSRLGRIHKSVRDSSSGFSVPTLIEDTSLGPFEERK